MSNSIDNVDTSISREGLEAIMALSLENYLPTTSENLESANSQSDIGPKSRRALVRGLYSLAKVYYDKADLEKAEQYFNKAMKYTLLPEDIFLRFKILGFLVRIASENLDSKKGESLITESEQLIEQTAQILPHLSGEYFYNLGTVKTYRGHFEQAKEYFNMAYEKGEIEQDAETATKGLYALATGYFYSKDYDKALEYLEKLDQQLKVVQKSYLLGTMYLLYGNIYVEKGEYQKSIDYFHKSNAALKVKNCWNLYSYILLGEGIVYKKMGEFSKSMIYFEMAKKSINSRSFKRLAGLLDREIQDVNDSTIDLYLDRNNRMVYEKNLGTIDFKHRFVLLEILFLLAENPGHYFGKENLAKAIWKDEYNPLIHDKLIYTSVSRLRKLIEPKENKRKYIIRGKDGYAFNQNVKVRLRKHESFSSSIGNIDLSCPV